MPFDSTMSRVARSAGLLVTASLVAVSLLFTTDVARSQKRIADINQDVPRTSLGSDPGDFCALSTTLAVFAAETDFGRELWAIDDRNVRFVADLESGSGGSNPTDFVRLGSIRRWASGRPGRSLR